MRYYRVSSVFIALLSLLHTSAASFAATVLYAETTGGLIYKSTDSAKTWQAIAVPADSPNAAGKGSALIMDPQNSNNLYSFSVTPALRGRTVPQYGINRSTDGGQTWTVTVLATAAAQPLAVDATSSNIIYMVGNGGVGGTTSYRSTDYGATFQAGTNPVFGDSIKTDPSQPGVVYLVGQANGANFPRGIYKSTDYGVTWALLATNATVFGNPSGVISDLAIDPKNSSVLYVTAYSSTCGTSSTLCGVLKSSDAGKTWQAVFGDSFGNVVVDGRNGNVYAGGQFPGAAPASPISGEIARSTDGGKTFSKITSGLTRLGVEVHLDPESPNVLYGSQSRTVGVDIGSSALQPAGIFVSTDSGSTWTLNKVDAALKPPNDQSYSLVAGIAPIAAEPTITQGGVVPIYSSVPVIQPGSWISIYGTGLGSGTTLWNGDFPTTLGGVSVTINNKPAYLWVVTPTQINLQAPDDTATGTVSVVVTTGSGAATSSMTLAQYGPSFSVLDGKHVAGVIATPDGSGAYGGGTYDLAGPKGAFAFNTRPVKAGETLILYGVGFGPTTPAVAAGKVFSGSASTNTPVTITIGGVNATVAFAGITQAGLYQFNLTVPATASGDQALQAIVNGVQTQAGPLLTVQ